MQFLLVKVMTLVEPSALSPSATAPLESCSSHPGETQMYSEFKTSECNAMHPLSHSISHRKSCYVTTLSLMANRLGAARSIPVHLQHSKLQGQLIHFSCALPNAKGYLGENSATRVTNI